jgi:hypothetical protein
VCRDELDKGEWSVEQRMARYKLRRGSTDFGEVVAEQESEERVRERGGARGVREEGSGCPIYREWEGRGEGAGVFKRSSMASMKRGINGGGEMDAMKLD